MTRGDNEMTIDPKEMLENAIGYGRELDAINAMVVADLPDDLDQDARDITRIIQEHGRRYAGGEYGDMTAPLLESLARLVEAAAKGVKA